MLTDVYFKIKRLWCQHEYVYYSTPYNCFYTYGWYKCRKCGRRTTNPPQQLIVKD